MSQPLANARSRTIGMIECAVVLQADNAEFVVMPSAEYDDNPAAIVHELDLFAP